VGVVEDGKRVEISFPGALPGGLNSALIPPIAPVNTPGGRCPPAQWRPTDSPDTLAYCDFKGDGVGIGGGALG